MSRDTLFISHATPEDNEFAIWLASRLEMIGYKTWIDKNYLLGGEWMWQDIQNIIENEAIKVLFVYSNNIRDSTGKFKKGIDDELSYAKSIAQLHSFKDFIIPLHIDNSSYSQVIGWNNVTQIPFQNSWADGLKDLLKKLEEETIIKQANTEESSISSWYQNEYFGNCKIINKDEIYYSSWWKILQMPDKFYLHVFKNKDRADIVKQNFRMIPISQTANILTTFEKDIKCSINDDMFAYTIIADKILEFNVKDVNNFYNSDGFPNQKDVENRFKYLLNDTMTSLFFGKGLNRYKFSKDMAYYQSKRQKFNFINIAYLGSKETKRKKIGGVYHSLFWHYAISVRSQINPIMSFSVKSHLLFTNDGKKAIDDIKFQGAHRRTKAKSFYNPEWRDLLLAFIQNLKDTEGEIKIPVTKNNDYLKMALLPEIYPTAVGYIDPELSPYDENETVENDDE